MSKDQIGALEFSTSIVSAEEYDDMYDRYVETVNSVAIDLFLVPAAKRDRLVRSTAARLADNEMVAGMVTMFSPHVDVYNLRRLLRKLNTGACASSAMAEQALEKDIKRALKELDESSAEDDAKQVLGGFTTRSPRSTVHDSDVSSPLQKL